MESLRENKALSYCLAAMGGFTLYLASEMDPAYNEWFELVPFPPEVRV